MTARMECAAFCAALAALIAVPLGPALIGGRVLSPSDLAYVQATFDREGEPSGHGYEPANRLLTDPMLQFEPWIEFDREMIRRGRLPLWNDLAGCGAPHLANGQSAVFDPFAAIAYIGTMPGALAWIAAARLFVAGVGMFALATAWGLGPWGRWFAGLCYPLCGFMTLWLLYPLASVAAWLPWLIASTEWAVRRGGPGAAAAVATCTALTLVGGHVQTAAHCLMMASAYLLVRLSMGRRAGDGGGASTAGAPRIFLSWSAAIGLGVATASVAVVPLGFYLSRSPAWEDRAAEHGSPWTLASPRLLEAATTGFPNLYGSQRRGAPNLSRALGTNNQNESAAGFSGLGTLIWLAPIGVAYGPRQLVAILGMVAGVGACASFRIPPIDNLLRALPVLDVTDHRRMTLWVAFGLVGLGALGLDAMGRWQPSMRWRAWVACWAAGAAVLAATAAMIPRWEEALRGRAFDHYSRSAELPPGDVALLAERQVRNLVEGYPRTLFMGASVLAALAAAASWAMARPGRAAAARPAVLGIVIVDLVASMWGANPTIAPEQYRPPSPVVDHLRREAPFPARVLAVGAELPPNMLMRYGLADVRNYDAIELANILAWLDPLYEPPEGGPEARSSRRAVTWEGVARARDRLASCGVRAVVGSSPPPPGLFDRVARIGRAWVGHWEADDGPAVITGGGGGRLDVEITDRGRAAYTRDDRIMIPVTYVPGWRARHGDRELRVSEGPGPFLWIEAPAEAARITLEYDPPEVRASIGISLAGLAVIALLVARGSGKNGPMALGPARNLALESVSKALGEDPIGPAPQSEGHDADGPLHV